MHVSLFVVVFVLMFMLAAIFRVTFGHVMVMKMKKSLQKKHRQKAAKRPFHGAIKRTQLLRSVREKMQQCDTEHEAGHETDGHLQSRVREVNQQRQPAARQRREQHERAVNDQQPTGRIHVASHISSVNQTPAGMRSADSLVRECFKKQPPSCGQGCPRSAQGRSKRKSHASAWLFLNSWRKI
jgi:hypothetical protein